MPALPPDSGPARLRTAHVLFIDIVGYSLLPTDEQSQAVQKLQSVVQQLPGFTETFAANELICIPTGDGMAVVCFDEPTTPARFARDLAIQARSEFLFALRMGLHSGPVFCSPDINLNTNVAGNGINVAQRIMDCGDGGHILCSQSVAETLQQLTAWRNAVHDAGECKVKHGVMLRVFNLCDRNFGNPALPSRMSKQSSSAAIPKRVPGSWSTPRRGLIGVIAATVAVALFLVFARSWFPSAHAFTDKDTLVLADFANSTGESVFDDTLRQGIAVQLEQSPFLSLISDERIRRALPLMGRPADTALTPAVAREVCQRLGSTAVLEGSIAKLGNSYVLTLRARNCGTGDVIASEQTQADRKEAVLTALTDIAGRFRTRVGESLPTLQKHSTPLPEATTSSLEALKAYSQAIKLLSSGGDANGIPLFERAVEIDPKFAMAWARIGLAYATTGELEKAKESLSRARQLRERVSDAERFFIDAVWETQVTGNLEKARRICETWAQTYPRESTPHGFLGGMIYPTLGQFRAGLEQAKKTLEIDPDLVFGYLQLTFYNVFLGDMQKANEAARQAAARHLEVPDLAIQRYQNAFLEGNKAGMDQEVSQSRGNAELEDWMDNQQAITYATAGQLQLSRRTSETAVSLARQSGQPERAAQFQAGAAVREALLENGTAARTLAMSALKLSHGRDVQYGVAFALALAGDSVLSGTLANDLESRFPEDTAVRLFYVPEIRALMAIDRHEVSRAIDLLKPAAVYELGTPPSSVIGSYGSLYPIYVRGLDLLISGRAAEAAAEFRKILDHHAILMNDLLVPVARLQLARALAATGDNSAARTVIQELLTTWKDADPDLRLLTVAKSVLSKL